MSDPFDVFIRDLLEPSPRPRGGVLSARTLEDLLESGFSSVRVTRTPWDARRIIRYRRDEKVRAKRRAARKARKITMRNAK